MRTIQAKKINKGITNGSHGAEQISVKRIAYLEDDEIHGAYLSNWLARRQISCEVFKSCTDFKEAITKTQYDLVLLDWELSGGVSGLDMLEFIRSTLSVELPVVFVSSKNTRDAVLTAISQGANDYITKPVHRSELLSRICNLTDQNEVGHTTRCCEPYLIDRTLCHIYLNGKTISLTPREYRLALTLFDNAGKTLSHEQLLTAVGGECTLKPYSEIEYLLHKLKKKLKFSLYSNWHVDKIGEIGFRLLADGQ